MRPNFKYEGKVVAVNLPDMDILACTSYTTGGSIEVLKPLETYGAVGILILNPDRPMAGVRWIRRYNNYPLDSYDFSIPVVGVSNNDAASQLLQTLILAESPVVVSLYHEVNIWVTAANTPFFFVYNWLLVIVLNCVLLIFALYIFYVFIKEARPPAGANKVEWIRVKVFGELRFAVYSLELIGTILVITFWSMTGPWYCSVAQPTLFLNIVVSFSLYPKNITTILTAILWWDSTHTIKKSPRTLKIVRFVCVLIVTITAVADVITKAMPSTNTINFLIGSLVVMLNQAIPGFYMLISAMRGVIKMRKALASVNVHNKYFEKQTLRFTRWILASGSFLVMFLLGSSSSRVLSRPPFMRCRDYQRRNCCLLLVPRSLRHDPPGQRRKLATRPPPLRRRLVVLLLLVDVVFLLVLVVHD